ncbi:uncharacterized protein LOC107624869, partial [Arachis ipaensis]|uniref:uncharacterized protein LOC107624869 n=1 Tax=Arachis ipaensis TaxID=130454 RepID=UPI000A2AFB02
LFKWFLLEVVVFIEEQNHFLVGSILKFRNIYGSFKCFHSKPNWGSGASDKTPKSEPNRNNNRVGIFWDLEPNPIPPYEVANKLRIVASSFGVVRHMVAYANSHTFTSVPHAVRQWRKEKELYNRLESKGVIKRNEPHVCRVCGRKFYTNEKLVNHFKQLHESEQMKRVNQIASAKGNRRVKLVAKYSMKMEKYKKAARDILTPRVAYGLVDELKRAGFLVQSVLDKPEAADHALESHMVDMMDHRWVECIVLVSDDYDFANVIREAKLRCLKTVVIGDNNDGVLKRIVDTSFSWEEILMGKARKEAVSVVENWKDHDILKRLEWKYNPEVDKRKYGTADVVIEESEDDNIEGVCDDVDDDYKDDGGSWWELDSNENVTNEQARKS